MDVYWTFHAFHLMVVPSVTVGNEHRRLADYILHIPTYLSEIHPQGCTRQRAALRNYGLYPIVHHGEEIPYYEMGHGVIENVEDREGVHVVRRKIIRTDGPRYPSGYRYALHYGYTDGRGTILHYDNENETTGRHERHTPDQVEEIDFPGMLALPDRFLDEIETLP